MLDDSAVKVMRCRSGVSHVDEYTFQSREACLLSVSVGVDMSAAVIVLGSGTPQPQVITHLVF